MLLSVKCRDQSVMCSCSHLSSERLRSTFFSRMATKGVRSWNSRTPSCHWKKTSNAAWRKFSSSWSMTGVSLRARRRTFWVSRCSTLEGDMVPVWVGLSCVSTLAGGGGLVRAYYLLTGGMLGMMTLAKLMRMPLINLPACSLVWSFSKALAALES